VNGKPALFIFLGICIVLAALLVLQVITTILGSVTFAISLAVLGGLSGGFRKKPSDR